MRRLSPLSGSVDSGEIPPLQIRLFRSVCAATGILCLLVILPLNVLQNLPVAVKVADFGLGLFAWYCFCASRWNRHHVVLFFVVVLGLLNPIWFLNAGSEGSINQYFLVLGLYPVAIFRGRRRWVFSILLGLNFCGLQLVEHFIPRFVVPYQHPADRLPDLLTGAFDSFLALTLIVWLIVEAHDQERRRLAESLGRLAASEKSLREHKEDLAEVLHVAAEGIAVQDPTAVVVECNQAAERILGLTREQIVGRRPADFIQHATHPDGRPFLPEDYPLTVAARTGRAQHGVEMMISGPGGSRPSTCLLINNEPIRDETGAVRRVVTSFNDITERKQAEADRLVLSKLESTGVLAGGIAHDFNNLLTGLLLNIELAGLALDSPPEIRLHLSSARQAVMAARNLTAQLITFAQGGEPVRRLLDLETLLRDSVRVSLHGSTITDSIAVERGLWPVLADEGQMGQVFRNLLLNAREAMPRGGRITIALANVNLQAAEVPALAPGDYLQLNIADQGEGIAPEVLPKIFDPYFSTKERGEQKGMGLGLTICRSVVMKHGGAIAVASHLGTGTTVSLYLPAARAPVPAPDQLAFPTATKVRSTRVLVMDDDETVRKAVGLVARQLGYAVTLAGDGQEALDHYRAAKENGAGFDLSILDLSVRNGMGGLETLQALHAMDPSAKAVVMSGYANDDVLHDHERHGFNGAIKKPFDISALRTAIAAALNK